jgi:hypothetical protein
MPLEVPHVPGFEVDGVSVTGVQDRDAGERTPLPFGDEGRRKHRADEQHEANDPETATLHEPSSLYFVPGDTP